MQLNKLQTDYTAYQRSYQLKLPIELNIIIPANDRVMLLSQFVDEMDLTDLYETYSRLRENQASPRIMLKLVLYAYLEGIYSSRAMEKACRRDINFMYLLESYPVPDHSTFARFRTEHFAKCATKIMSYVTNYLYSIDELSGKEIFIDGTKIEANANKYTFVWKRAVTKNFSRLMEKSVALAQECVATYALKPVHGGKVKLKHLKRIKKDIAALCKERHIVFVHGSGKRKTQLQRHFEELKGCIDKFKEYIKKLHTCGERNSYSKTDNDATFMRLKEDAMLNGQLKPAYNLQLGVDSGYISWLMLSAKPTDTSTLRPFLTGMHKNLDFRYSTVVADAGYESEENYSYIEDEGMTAMIKPADYEISKTRRYRNDISRRENMAYDKENDRYTCKAGNYLEARSTYIKKTASGYSRKVTVYQCDKCKGCQFKSECIKGRNWKTPEDGRFKKLNVSRKFEEQRRRCLERIVSEESCMLRMNRSIYAEGAFAVMKEDRNFRRFLTRGNLKVTAECILMAVSQNIAQLHRRIQTGKTGHHLYGLKNT